MEKKNLLGSNIKYLRKVFGQTQFELAMDLDIKSPNAISNYESGRRYPDPDIKKKIAKHFRITEEELETEDLSGLEFPTVLLENPEKSTELLYQMFPVVSSKKASENLLFKKGYEAHRRILEAAKEDSEFTGKDMDVCFEAYTKLYEENELPEAIANLLSWLFVVETFERYEDRITKLDELPYDKRTDGKALLKSFLLKNRDDTESKKDLKEFNELFLELVKKLKRANAFSELADYYMAMRYLLDFVDNGKSEETNRMIGVEMLWSLREIENRYAVSLILCLKGAKTHNM